MIRGGPPSKANRRGRSPAALLALVFTAATLPGCTGSSSSPPSPSSAAAPSPASSPSPAPREAADEVVRIPLPATPFRVDAGEGSVWVLSRDPEPALWRIDPATNQVVGKPTLLPDEPWDFAVGAGSVWVSQNNGVLIRVDARTGRIVARIAARPIYLDGEVAFGDGVVWTGNDDERYRGGSTVSKIDPATDRPVGGPVVLGSPQSLAAGDGALWVAEHDGFLAKIDAATLHVVARAPLRFGPHGVVIGDDAIYVADAHGSRLLEADPRTAKVRRAVDMPFGPIWPVLGGGSLWASSASVWESETDDDRIMRVDPATLSVTQTIHAGGPVSEVTYGFGSVWASVETGYIARITPEPEPPAGVLAFDCYAPAGTKRVTAADTLCTGSPGGPRHRITSPALARFHGGAVSPAWSPDSGRLLVRLAQSEGNRQLDDIGMVGADGSNFVNLTDQPEEANWGAAWSPDGTRIVFNSVRGRFRGAPRQRLWVMNADGSGLHRITSIWGEYPEWSPDGRLIAFMSNRCGCNGAAGAEYDLYTVRPDGTGLRRLTSWPGEEAVSGWSPDGQWIAYTRDPDATPGIWMVSRDGTRTRRLRPSAPDVQLRGTNDWASDGSFLMTALEGSDPTTSPEAVYWVSGDGRWARPLFERAEGGVWRPAGDARAVGSLTLEHRWITGGGVRRLEVSGRLTVGGKPAAGRRVILGRLGATLPTHRLSTVTTDQQGSFSVRLGLAGSPRWGTHAFHAYWCVVTAYFPGSDADWTTTAFDVLWG